MVIFWDRTDVCACLGVTRDTRGLPVWNSCYRCWYRRGIAVPVRCPSHHAGIERRHGQYRRQHSIERPWPTCWLRRRGKACERACYALAICYQQFLAQPTQVCNGKIQASATFLEEQRRKRIGYRRPISSSFGAERDLDCAAGHQHLHALGVAFEWQARTHENLRVELARSPQVEDKGGFFGARVSA